MLDLSKLSGDTLQTVRRALGGAADDTSYDMRIATMTPERVVALYAQWFLGSEQWGKEFYRLSHSADSAVIS